MNLTRCEVIFVLCLTVFCKGAVFQYASPISNTPIDLVNSTDSPQPSQYRTIIQNLLQTVHFGSNFQSQLRNFLRVSNVTFPMAVMTPNNLQIGITNLLTQLGDIVCLEPINLQAKNGSSSHQNISQNENHLRHNRVLSVQNLLQNSSRSFQNTLRNNSDISIEDVLGKYRTSSVQRMESASFVSQGSIIPRGTFRKTPSNGELSIDDLFNLLKNNGGLSVQDIFDLLGINSGTSLKELWKVLGYNSGQSSQGILGLLSSNNQITVQDVLNILGITNNAPVQDLLPLLGYSGGNSIQDLLNLFGNNATQTLQDLLEQLQVSGISTEELSDILRNSGLSIKDVISIIQQGGGSALLNQLISHVNMTFTTGTTAFPIGLSEDNVTLQNTQTGNCSFTVNNLISSIAQNSDLQTIIGSFMYNLQSNGIYILPSFISCLEHLALLTQDTQTTFSMLDATGKIPSGLIQGHFVWPGSFEECISTKAHDNSSSTIFGGRHCIAKIPIGEFLEEPILDGANVTAELGICVPDTCDDATTHIVINALLNLVPLGDVPLTAESVSCQIKPDYDPLGIIGIFVFGLFGCLLISGTLADMVFMWRSQKEDQSKTLENFHQSGDLTKKYNLIQQPAIIVKLLLSFSVYSNGRMILKADEVGGTLGAVNGIRVISLLWLILGHTFLFFLGGKTENPFAFTKEVLQRGTSTVILNSSLSIDSFFTLSGILVAYLFMREMERKRGKLNLFKYYFHRFWRLTPPYMMVMFLNISVSRYIGDGPFWPKDGFENGSCKDTWWTNLLYINNFVRAKEMCMPWSWYLANDMQFFVLSPIFLYPLHRSRKMGVFVCLLALLLVTIATATVSVVYDIPSFPISTIPVSNQSEYIYQYYIRPYCRIGPYIVGILTGYALYVTKEKYKMKKAQTMIIWCVITMTGLLVVYGVYGTVNGHIWDTGLSALYLSIHRTIWGICVSWVVFACVTGNGGFVNSMLSWKPFVPLSRLTYCLYLVHPIVLLYYTSSMRHAIYASTMNFIYIYLGTVILSFLVAFVASLAFEAPLMKLAIQMQKL